MERLSTINHLQEARNKNRLHHLGEHAYGRFNTDWTQLFDTKTEIDAYLAQLDMPRSESIATYYADLEETPLPNQLSAYVIVPVAAAQETDTLIRTLEQYAKQDADPSTWALLLYINEVADSSMQVGAAIDETYRLIDTFKAQHPELAIRTTYTSYLDKAPPIGTIRGEIWDVALYDVLKNGVAHNNLIGISHDADIEWLSPDYISKMQQAAIDDPTADLLTCRLSWQNDGAYNSDANKILRYWEYLGLVNKNKIGEFGASDANTAIRLGTYAAIGGFNRHIDLAEMIDIRERIALARGLPQRSTDHIAYVDSIRLKTNSRRIYRAIANGYAPDYAWDRDLPFLTGDDPVRKLDTHELGNLYLEKEALRQMLCSMEEINLYKLDHTTRQRLQRTGRHILCLPVL